MAASNRGVVYTGPGQGKGQDLEHPQQEVTDPLDDLQDAKLEIRPQQTNQPEYLVTGLGPSRACGEEEKA